MGVVIVKVTDDTTSFDCGVEVLFSGEVSDTLKDFFSDPEYWTVIRDNLSDVGFFSENVVQ